jgi:diguanylate cyclase (GGDEF)-like protein
MLDLDHFKRINDQFGHASGDAALLTFANALRTAFPQALQGRLGGEEFALLSPLLTAEQLSQQLDRFREQLSTLSYSPGAPPLSFSAGVYQGWDDKLENLLRLADENLYQAKANGRGRTVQLVQAPG